MTETARPSVLPVNPASIPDELRAISQWVGWRFELRDGRWTKPPVNVRTGRHADKTDQTHWVTFDEALTAVTRLGLDGVGLVLTEEDAYAALDLDHCVDDNGTISPEARTVLEDFDSYTERSPSGNGLRIFFRGKLPRNVHRPHVEAYDRSWYLTTTGQVFEERTEIRDRQAVVDRYAEAGFFEKAQGAPAQVGGTGRVEEPGGTNGGDPTAWAAQAYRETLTDGELLQLARSAKNGKKFLALWQGDVSAYPSPSEADAALCCLLAFWTGPDPERIDRLFRKGGLMRPKWDERRGEETYGTATIRNAIAAIGGRYYTSESPTTTEDALDVLRGLAGLRVRIHAVHRERRWTSLQFLLICPPDDEQLAFSVNTTPTAIDRCARDIQALAPGIDLPAIKTSLRRLLARAENMHRNDRHPLISATSVIAAEAERLRLSFTDDGDRAWSETLGRFLYQRQFTERMILSRVINQLASTEDFWESKRSAIITGAKRLAEEAFANIVARLPDQADAESLGPDSKAAARAREALEKIWLQPRTFSRSSDGYTASESLAGRAFHDARLARHVRPDDPSPWRPMHRAFAAYWRIDEQGHVRLAMRYELLAQTSIAIPGVHDQKTLGKVLTRYGLADHEAARCGPSRTKVREISADLARQWSASCGEQDLDADTTSDRSSCGHEGEE